MCPASNRRKFTATPYTTGPGGARTGGDAFDAPSLLAKALRELRPGASAEFLGKSWDVSMVLWISMNIYGYHWISMDYELDELVSASSLRKTLGNCGKTGMRYCLRCEDDIKII